MKYERASLLTNGTYLIVLSVKAFEELGMDDNCRYPDIKRWGRRGHYIGLSGDMNALVNLATELSDRATDGGFYATPASRRICSRAVDALERQGVDARD